MRTPGPSSPIPSAFHRHRGCSFFVKNRSSCILVFRAPGKIFALKSLCTDGVDFVSGKAENFFKLWIVLKFVCITGGIFVDWAVDNDRKNIEFEKSFEAGF